MEQLIRIRTFEDLRVALAGRKLALGLRNLDVDHIAGLQGGYTGKLLCGMKNPGEMSLPALLGALRCALILVPVDGPCETTSHRSEALAEYDKRADASKIVFKMRGKKSRDRRMISMTPEERRKSAKKAAAARWKIHRLRKAREAQEGRTNVIALDLKEPSRRAKKG